MDETDQGSLARSKILSAVREPVEIADAVVVAEDAVG
jgi:hypothetical protein